VYELTRLTLFVSLQYIQYGKLKRIIERLQFIAQKKNERSEKAAQAIEDSKAQTFLELVKTASFASQKSEQSSADERTPLTTFEQLEETKSYTAPPAIPKGAPPSTPKGTKKGKARGVLDDGLDFFACILEEMNTANTFYIGKCAELRYKLKEMTEPRSNTYITHHTSTDPNFLNKLRSIYIELVALKQYSELNKTGFYKIIKKYDKAMDTNTLDEWQSTIDGQPFTLPDDVNYMMEVVDGLVSRGKLMEWERFASEQKSKINDDIFPSVRPLGILAAVVVFLVSSYVPLISAGDPCARRCLTLLLTTLTLWVSEAIPYYTTALLVPIFVTTMNVLKDPLRPGHPLTTEAAATFVMNSMCNHTTFLLLGGYTISTAFARCRLELRVAAWLQKRFGNTPQLFILAVMFLGLFLSMWINNHTAPILCATIILPVVRDLPTDSR
jgi:phosphate transporter